MTPTTTATAPHPSHVSQLATTADVARFLQLDAYTVRAYAREGIIPAYRVGRTFRFDMSTVAAWLEARATHPSTVDDDPPQLQLVEAPAKRPGKATR
jgi:excisionase family DNA binding protein